MADLVNLLNTDQRILQDAFESLVRGHWVDRSGRGFVVSNTSRAGLLLSLLPEFSFNFAPTAFLAGFVENSSASAKLAAIRLAAISHQDTDLFNFYNPPVFARSKGDNVNVSSYEKHVPRILTAETCQFPEHLLKEGTLWMKIAAWQRGDVTEAGYSTNICMEEAEPHLPDVDVSAGTVVKGSIFLRLSTCLQVKRLVEVLEPIMGLPSNPSRSAPPALILAAGDVERIQDELLSAFMNGFIRIMPPVIDTGAKTPILDLVAIRSKDVQQWNGDVFRPRAVPVTAETPKNGHFAVAQRVRKDVILDGEEVRACWSMADIVVIPISAMKRWEKANGLKIFDVAKSSYLSA